jgi:alginate O-acetyltransferase complex protein AlgI
LIALGSWWLLAASLFFYGYAGPKLLFLIFASVTINYLLGKVMLTKSILSRTANHANQNRSAVLVVGIIFNVCFLAYFKYTNLLIENITAVQNKLIL